VQQQIDMLSRFINDPHTNARNKEGIGKQVEALTQQLEQLKRAP